MEFAEPNMDLDDMVERVLATGDYMDIDEIAQIMWEYYHSLNPANEYGRAGRSVLQGLHKRLFKTENIESLRSTCGYFEGEQRCSSPKNSAGPLLGPKVCYEKIQLQCQCGRKFR